jgi:hypothetical protein
MPRRTIRWSRWTGTTRRCQPTGSNSSTRSTGSSSQTGLSTSCHGSSRMKITARENGGGIRDLSGATGADRGPDGRRQPARGPHPSRPMQVTRPCSGGHPRRSLFSVARRGCCWAGCVEFSRRLTSHTLRPGFTCQGPGRMYAPSKPNPTLSNSSPIHCPRPVKYRVRRLKRRGIPSSCRVNSSRPSASTSCPAGWVRA